MKKIFGILVIVFFIFILLVKLTTSNINIECIEKFYNYSQSDVKYVSNKYGHKNIDDILSENIKNENLKFYCLQSMGSSILPFTFENKYIKKYGVQGCLCISDVVKNEEQNKIDKTIGNFVITYNKKLMSYIKTSEN